MVPHGKVGHRMTHFPLPIIDLRRARRVAAVAMALGLACSGLAAGVAAQQPPAAKPVAPKAPAAAPPAQKSGAAAPAGAQNAWVRLCEIVATGTTFKGGKEEPRGSKFCLTQHERLDGNTGLPIVSAAVRQMEGEEKQYFMVLVPLGMLLEPGLRVALYPKDQWELAQKNQKVDENKLKGLRLEYNLCHPGGCTAQAETTPELISDLKTMAGMVIFGINTNRAPSSFSINLSGFDKAYAGPEADAKQYSEGRRALQVQIAKRRQEMAEQMKKQADEQKAAPAPAAPPPAKK